MIKYLKKLFTKETEPEMDISKEIDAFKKQYSNEDRLLENLDIEEPEVCGNINSNKVLLLVDDQPTVFFLYKVEFETILDKHGYDIAKKFKIVKCVGPKAGFIANKYLQTASNEIVIAILDLTLGCIIKVDEYHTIVYDGVDIALDIIKKHPMCKIGVCTAHMLDTANPVLSKLINKFNKTTGHNLLDYAFSKNDDRASHIYKMITEVNNVDFTKYGGWDNI